MDRDVLCAAVKRVHQLSVLPTVRIMAAVSPLCVLLLQCLTAQDSHAFFSLKANFKSQLQQTRTDTM